MFSYSTGYYVSPPDDQYLKFKNRCSLLRIAISWYRGGKHPTVLGVELSGPILSELSRAGIFKKSMGARHRVGIGLSYRPARIHRLAECIPWN
jgi:hypothetical protein